jgi:hypothetical protein
MQTLSVCLETAGKAEEIYSDSCPPNASLCYSKSRDSPGYAVLSGTFSSLLVLLPLVFQLLDVGLAVP